MNIVKWLTKIATCRIKVGTSGKVEINREEHHDKFDNTGKSVQKGLQNPSMVRAVQRREIMCAEHEQHRETISTLENDGDSRKAWDH